MHLLVTILVPVLWILAVGAFVLLVRKLVLPSGPVRLEVNDRLMDATPGSSVLEALGTAGVLIPSGCGGKGTCGYCKVRFRSGDVPVLPTDSAWISGEELAQGYRLACQHRIFGDMAIEVPEKYLSIRRVQATLKAARMLTPDIRELVLHPDESLDFKAGQYVQVEIGDTEEQRAYSIACAEGSQDIILNVRLVPGGLGSTWLHSLPVGKSLFISGPYGDYELPGEHGTQLLLVAGGVGLAPISSLVRTVAATRNDMSVRVFLGFRTLEHAYYLDEFGSLSHPDLEMHVALDSEQREGFYHGFVHEMIKNVYEPPQKQPVSVFLCGPPPMIEAVMDVLSEMGISRSDMFYDKF